jgi:hypothetical protein
MHRLSASGFEAEFKVRLQLADSHRVQRGLELLMDDDLIRVVGMVEGAWKHDSVMNELAFWSARQVNMSGECIRDLAIALSIVAISVGPAGILIAIPSVPVRSLAVVSGASSDRPLVAIIAVARSSVRLSPVVIAVVVAGAAPASTARCVGVPLLITGVIVARVEIKHRDLHVNQFPRGRTPSLQWAVCELLPERS